MSTAQALREKLKDITDNVFSCHNDKALKQDVKRMKELITRIEDREKALETICPYKLVDTGSDVEGPHLEVTTTFAKDGLGVGFIIKDYGTLAMDPGESEIIHLDYFNSKLQLLVWPDIQNEEPLRIPLNRAHEYYRLTDKQYEGEEPVADPQAEWYVVQLLKKEGDTLVPGKYADGYYGWDASVNDLEMVFRGDELPYEPNDRMKFILVGTSYAKPNLRDVREALKAHTA
jgi:hypothetical protein